MHITTTIDSIKYDVRFDNGILTANGMELPSSKFAVDFAELGMDLPLVKAIDHVVNGLHYRFEYMESIVVTSHCLEDDEIAFQGDGWCIVNRTEPARPRPLLAEYNGIMCRFEVGMEDDLLMRVIQIMADDGLVPVAMIDKKVFFMTKENRRAVYKRFGILTEVPNRRELITRLGVLLKRPGGRSFPLRLKGIAFSEAENDGTIAVVDRLYEAVPGTFISDGFALKGMIRPPFEAYGVKEPPMFCQDAQFGRKVDSPIEGTFHAVRRLTTQRASMNLQALVFTHEDPVGFIQADNTRVRKMGPIDLVRKSNRAKIEAGIPTALLMDKAAPWKWLRRFQFQAVSTTVFASNLVKRKEGIMLLPETARELAKVSGIFRIEKGTPILLHRDPAKPDHTAMHSFRFDGVIHWAGRKGGHGIVLNPKSRQWKASGGDFDGDSGVIALDKGNILDDLEVDIDYRRSHPTPMTPLDGKPHFEGTLLALNSTFAGSLGSTVLTAMKLWEVGELTDERAIQLAALIQAAVDSQKHPVDGRRAAADYRALYDLLEEYAPPEGYLVEMTNALTAASSDAERVARWEDLVLWSTLDHQGAYQQAMAERIKELDRLYRDSGFLRQHRLQMPETLRNAAKTQLLGEDTAAEQVEWVRNRSAAFRRLTRALAQTEDEEAGGELREQLNELRGEFEIAYHSGNIAGAALLAYAPARLAAELVHTEDVVALALEAREAVVCLLGTPTDGVHSVEALDPIPTEVDEWRALTMGAETVDVRVIATHDSYVRAHVRVEGEKHFEFAEVLEADGDEDPFA